MMAWIYRIVRLETDQCYIGHTSHSVERRFFQHTRLLKGGRHHSRYLQNAWNKHGSQAFKFETIEECEDCNKLVREQYYIDTLQSVYNTALVAGSRKGVLFTAEQKANVSAALMGHKVSEETRRKLSIAHSGKIHAPHTDDAKTKIGAASEKWWQENEQTPAQLAASRKAVEIARQSSPFGPGYVPTHRIGAKDSDEVKARRTASVRAALKAKGRTRFITDGAIERKILIDAPVPDGWRYGRQPKIGAVGRSRTGEKRSAQARQRMSHSATSAWADETKRANMVAAQRQARNSRKV